MNPPRPTQRAAFGCLLVLALVMPLVPAAGGLVVAKHALFLGLTLVGGLLLALDALAGGEAPALGTPTDLALGAFLVLAALSIPGAANPGVARYDLGRLLAMALVFLLAVRTVRSPGDARRLLGAVLASALVVALLVLDAYREFTSLGLPESERSRALATALFPHSYLAAQYLVPVLTGGIVFAVDRQVARRTRRMVALALLPLAAAMLVIGSRGAYLAVAVALVVSGLLRAASAADVEGGHRPRARVVRVVSRSASAAAVVLLVLVGARVAGAYGPGSSFPGLPALAHGVDRVLSLGDPTATELNFSRLGVWQHTLDLWSDHVLRGAGLGSFDTVLPSYHPTDRSVPHAHNQFLHVLAECGVLGLLGLLFVVRAARHQVQRSARYLERDVARRALFHAAAAALLATLLSSLFETPLHWVESGSLVMLLLGLVTRAGCSDRDRPTPLPATAAAVLLLGSALVVALPSWTGYGRATTLAARAGELAEASREARLAGDTDQAGQLADEALALLGRADDSFPHRSDFAALAAALCADEGRLDEALAWHRVADQRTPGTFLHLNAVGKLLLSLGQAQEAVDPLRRAIAANMSLTGLETYAALGRAYAAAGRYEEAWFVFADLVDRNYYEAVQPAILLDAVRTLVALDREFQRAKVMLDTYRRLVPGATDEPGYMNLRHQVNEARGREKRTPAW